MTAAHPSLFARHDTFFGVCEAIGQDFGFNSNWLRLGFAALLFVSPIAMLATYAALGLVVLATRLAFPTRPAQPVAQPLPLRGDNDAEAPALAEAA